MISDEESLSEVRSEESQISEDEIDDNIIMLDPLYREKNYSFDTIRVFNK